MEHVKEQETIQEWYGCYKGNWSRIIDPSSFSHPAKFSHSLIKRLFEYAIEKEWIKPGDQVIDPFGGVGLGSLYAAENGIFWTGVELERDFVVLGYRNFTSFCEKRWCTCGDNGRDYLYSVRESVREKLGRDKPKEETENGSVLQQGMQKQLSLFGEEMDPGTTTKSRGEDSLEPGGEDDSRNQGENIREGQAEDRRQKFQLEGGEVHQEGRVYRDSGERGIQDRTYPDNGESFGPAAGERGGCSPQEWGSSRQPNREPGTNDNLPTYETSSPQRSETVDSAENLRNLRGDIPGEKTSDYMQRSMQAATVSRVLAQIRRQEEGNFCRKCGKLIVVFPVLLQGDSRYLRANLAAGFGGVVSSPPYANGCAHTGGADPNPQHIQGGKMGVYGVEDSYGSTPGQLGAMTPGSFDATIGSPPFAGNTGGQGEASRNGINAALFDRHQGGMKRGTGDDPRNLDHLPMGDLDGVIGSPPYANGEKGHPSLGSVNKDGWGTDGRDIAARRGVDGNYGATSGQLANFTEGDLSAAIGSPPFAGSIGSDTPEKRGGLLASDPRRAGDRSLTGSYGQTEGQLGGMKDELRGMKDERANGVVSSPPFENQNACNDPNYHTGRANGGGPLYGDYGSTPGQLGAESRETFWAAARQILTETFHLLKPGAVAIWVCKAFVRDGQIVDFPGQWRQLSEACGFEFVEEIRAMQVSRPKYQATLAGETTVIQKATKSFFRRNYEKKFPDNRIDWETVVIMRKPFN